MRALDRILKGRGGSQLLPLVAKIRALFANGEQGWWYDPSNMSTLFQDSAGTTPVTAMEQPVGLQLDLSKGLVLGSELVTNGDFSNGTTGWNAISGAVLSVISGELEIKNGTANYGFTYQSFPTVVGKTYKVSASGRIGSTSQIRVTVGTSAGTQEFGILPFTSSTKETKTLVFTATATTTVINGINQTNVVGNTGYISNVSIKELPGNHRFQSTSANRPVVSARVNLLTATSTLATQSVTTAAANYTLAFAGTGSVTLSGTATGTYSAGTRTITCTAGTLTITVSGSVLTADLRPTNQGVNLPAYQRVNTSTDYDSTGFPVYIKPNGSNQFMQTNSINFTATDKMTVWQGVRKLSDAANASLTEFSYDAAATNGGFVIFAPAASGANKFQFTSRGTSTASAITTSVAFNAPTTNVVTGIGDISGDSAILRVNTSQAAISTADQGTGNYGNYPAYFYSRAGTGNFFNGNDYGSIARGAASTAAQIAAGEKYINSKTKAF